MGEPGVGAKGKGETDVTDAGDRLQTPLKQQAVLLPITLPFPIVCWYGCVGKQKINGFWSLNH